MNDRAGELEAAIPSDILDLAWKVLQAAKDGEVMLATAESCTGGLLAALLTDVSGFGRVFDRGFVSYSDRAKCDLLGIERQMVDDCGAVSRQVAEAMAKGALDRSQADIAVSVTGFAGPGAEDDEEGLVHFALATRDGALSRREEHFGPIGRDGVRIAALRVALTMMDESLAEIEIGV
ncbi:CinA family protein [Qipengyuania sp. MTN3-11]|uniref:CinA family protein n=1 Tax=Qipengyuania sp. MTN3-11 TaxID=3056557 RepID=UPI0036F23788